MMRRELIFCTIFGGVLGRTGDITALYMKEYYNAVGTFEAHFPAFSGAGKIMLKNDYIIAVGDGFNAIITSATLNAGEIAVYGRTLNWILSRRLCAPFGSYEDENGETVTLPSEAAKIAEDKVTEAWSGCINIHTSGISGHEIEFSKSSYTPCGDIVIDVLTQAGLGHRVDFSPKAGLDFVVFNGIEQPLVLSQSLKNATNSSYTKDLLDHYNTPYVEGGDLVHSDNITDWEKAVDNVNDIEKYKIKKEITCEAVGLICGKDYNLGDIIRVTEEFCSLRFSSRLRVVGVERWVEYNDAGEKPILEELS